MKPDTCPHIELLPLTDKRDNWQCEPVGIEFTANAYAALRIFEAYEISISDVLDMAMEKEGYAINFYSCGPFFLSTKLLKYFT